MDAGFRDVGMQQGAANSLFGMGMDQYNLGRTFLGDQAQQGQQQQNLNQSILGLADQYLNQYLQSPGNASSQLGQILQGSPLMGNTTQTMQPGLYDYLGLGLQAGFGGGK